MTQLVPLSAAGMLGNSTGGGTIFPRKLSRKAKAAIVVRILLNEGADIPLEDLPEDLQTELTRCMGSLRVIDRDTLSDVVDEFVGEVERIGLRFPGGIAGALDALDGKINPHTAARLRKEEGVREIGDPWQRIRALEPELLLPVLEAESIEIAAVVLSKLETKKAAELLGKLPGPRAREITYAVSQTSAVTPSAVDRIGLSLASQLSVRPARAFEGDPVERVGAILNSSTSLTRDDVLAGLDETDEGFARAVRKAIFTFANIPTRIAPRDVPRILRDVDQADLVIAMAGAEATGMQASADYILENMSGRMADQLREEVSEAPKPKATDVEAAMQNIVGVVRELEASGDITLISDDDEEEET
ncbi:MAG: FliG C-terminal domain-containing protein [Pseudomonadota bacterium]